MIGIGATVLAVEGRACPRCEEPLTLLVVAGDLAFCREHRDVDAHVVFARPRGIESSNYLGVLTYNCPNCGNRVDVWLTKSGEWEVVET